MRASRFTDEQIMQALRRVKDGTPAAQVCRTLGITETTFYRWRTRYDAAAHEESRELRSLREENVRLKQLVAEMLLERQAPPVARTRR
jgi:putative transposase